MKVIFFILPFYLFLFVFYGLKNPKGFLLLTGIFTIPFRTTYDFFTINSHSMGWTNSISLSLSDVSFFSLFLYLLLSGDLKGSKRNEISNSFFFFVIACIPSLINSSWTKISFLAIVMLLKSYFLYYYVFIRSLTDFKVIESVVDYFSFTIIFQGIFSIIQFTTGNPLDFFSTGRGAQGMLKFGDTVLFNRAFGTVGKPNSFAAFIVPIIFILLALYLFYPVKRKLRLFGLTLGLIALILSFSRGGWLSFALALVFILFMAVRKGFLNFSTVFKYGIVLTLLIIPFSPYIVTRIFGGDHNAALSRIPLMKISLNMFLEHPFVGVGINTFRSVIHHYTTSPDLKDIYLNEVHNQYLLILSEIGIIGLIFYLNFLYRIFKALIRSSSISSCDFCIYLGYGLSAGFFATLIHMNVDIFNSALNFHTLFMMAGLATACIKLRKDPEPILEKRMGMQIV
ncbi:O-Antigen ligase [bacterium BMS3Abin03]|nr:O-Antigen ligase [bacterium BMS3Abin03]